jgi:tetratricopeptide (TPR) repeat protein
LSRTVFALLTAPLLAMAAFAQAPATTPAKPDEPKKTESTKPVAVSPDVEKALELFKQDKAGEALELLKKSAKANPTQLLPKVQLAQWFLQAQKGQNARILTEQAIAEEPRHPEGYIWNGNIAFNEGRITEAMLNLSMALLLSEDKRWDTDTKKRYQKEIRYGLVSCYETRGDMPGSKEQLIGLLNDDTKNAGLRQRLAATLFRMDSVEEARKELIQAYTDDATVDPPELKLAQFWQAKANSEGDAKKAAECREKAEDWYKKTTSTYAKNAKGYREYSMWLLEAYKTEAAGLYIEQALKLEPTSTENLAAKSLYLLYKKDFAGAETLLEAMYKESPNNLFAIGNLCIALAESNDEKKKKRSVELGQALTTQFAKSPVAYSIFGWALYKSGRTDDAEKALNTSATAGQLSYDTAYFFAKLAFDKAKYPEAMNFLKPALEAQHGSFVYREDAKLLIAEVVKKLPAPEKKDPPK